MVLVCIPEVLTLLLTPVLPYFQLSMTHPNATIGYRRATGFPLILAIPGVKLVSSIFGFELHIKRTRSKRGTLYL